MKIILGLVALLVIISPVILLILLLVYMVRKRRRQEQSGTYKVSKYAYRQLVEPFTWSDNWLTCLLLAVLAIVYAGEAMFALDGPALTPTVLSLISFGGASKVLIIKEGQWFRLFTAPMLHGNLPHLIGNAIALFYAGRVVESQIGRSWFLTIYFIGSLCGSLMSISLNDANVIGVGASGAIMGLFAAILAISYHARNEEKRSGLRFLALRVVIPSLLPGTTAGGSHIDIAAHLGGAVWGILCAVFLLIFWSCDEQLPRLQGWAKTISVLFIAITLLAFGKVALGYPTFQKLNGYHQSCITRMQDYAKQNGKDPKKYMADNKSYLTQCVQYYIKANHLEDE